MKCWPGAASVSQVDEQGTQIETFLEEENEEEEGVGVWSFFKAEKKISEIRSLVVYFPISFPRPSNYSIPPTTHPYFLLCPQAHTPDMWSWHEPITGQLLASGHYCSQYVFNSLQSFSPNDHEVPFFLIYRYVTILWFFTTCLLGVATPERIHTKLLFMNEMMKRNEKAKICCCFLSL